MSDRPRILIFTGDGKGKTTAALGLALRASGYGMRVCILQFLKADAATGEVAALARDAHIELYQTGLGFPTKPSETEWGCHQAAARAGLERARNVLAAGRHEVVILDEICLAVASGLLAEAEVTAVLRAAPCDRIVVLTGRGATPGLMAQADTVTEMRCIKHGLQAGQRAQRGVER